MAATAILDEFGYPSSTLPELIEPAILFRMPNRPTIDHANALWRGFLARLRSPLGLLGLIITALGFIAGPFIDDYVKAAVQVVGHHAVDLAHQPLGYAGLVLLCWMAMWTGTALLLAFTLEWRRQKASFPMPDVAALTAQLRSVTEERDEHAAQVRLWYQAAQYGLTLPSFHGIDPVDHKVLINWLRQSDLLGIDKLNAALSDLC